MLPEATWSLWLLAADIDAVFIAPRETEKSSTERPERGWAPKLSRHNKAPRAVSRRVAKASAASPQPPLEARTGRSCALRSPAAHPRSPAGTPGIPAPFGCLTISGPARPRCRALPRTQNLRLAAVKEASEVWNSALVLDRSSSSTDGVRQQPRGTNIQIWCSV